MSDGATVAAIGPVTVPMAKDPNTGEQLVTLADFFKHGAAVLLLSFLVLWLWVILGYWVWLGFPGF